MPIAVIVGNCQAQLLEAIFIAHTDWTVLRIPPVFLLDSGHRDEIQSLLSKADYIFSQRVTDSYPLEFIRTNELKKHFNNTISWPNIYFSGYFPDIEYIYIDGIGKLVGPLDDYHPTLLLDLYKAGGSVTDAVRAYQGDAFDERYPDPINRTLIELESRESGLDTKISDYIRENAHRKKLFFTVNHPINDLLFEMAERLLASAGHPMKLNRHLPYSLSRINIPIYPRITAQFGIAPPPPTCFVGIDRLSIHRPTEDCASRAYLDTEDMFDAFFRFYDTVFQRPTEAPQQ